MKAADIRQRYLSWFQGQGHTIVPSSSLVPHNDPTLYFANAGMVQFKDLFLGAEKRDYVRATTVQKCMRVSGKHNDLENVGRTPRHHTFFEMLGNFSFGDYFKEEAIPYAWELLTGHFAIDPQRLWVTVFEEDDEAYDIWRSKVGVSPARIQRLGAKENFWSMGDTGPCGPCTEIHYDHGPAIDSDERGPAFESGRYIEIWNLVFMQFDQAADGTRTRLPRPSIDTGMGLERLAAVLQGVYSNYDTDLFTGLITRAAERAQVRYGQSEDVDTALRVMADHARAATFMVADGVMPSNEGRGYVLRRILRRAIRFGVKIGLDRPFFHDITDRVIVEFGATYPELVARQAFIREIIQAEEERFRRTLDRGMKLLNQALDDAGNGGRLNGDLAFTLSDTFGFPLDLTELIAAERNISVDNEGFVSALGEQKERGRKAWKGSGEQAVAGLWQQISEEHGKTEFQGYESHTGSGAVVALVAQVSGDDGASSLELVDELPTGARGVVILDRTPFYGESGGQAGDAGTLSAEGGHAAVRETLKASGLHLHHVEVEDGALHVGDVLAADVDGRRRSHTRRNHTATHLLHAALREVLGDHVSQKGSLVSHERLRFDFAHHKAMTEAELQAVESIVNEQILRNTAVETRVESIEEATARGAMALFGEKYDSVVRVVDVPGFSLELCGGTHVSRTGDIGLMRIQQEAGIAAGVRRIEAQTGHGALALVRGQESLLKEAATALKTEPERILDAISKLRDQRRDAERRAVSAEEKLQAHAAEALKSQAIDVGGVKVLAARLTGDLRAAAEALRTEMGTSVVVLAAEQGGKAVLVVGASKDLAGRVHAGKIVEQSAPAVGGRGGGRPDLAQAGGDNPAGIDAALAKAVELIRGQLGA